MEPDHTSPALHQKCTIWKYGIKWTTRSFVDALVEVNDERVILLLRCKEGKELSLVKLRSQLIQEILSVKDEFCSNAETIDMFVPNPTYPVDTKSSILLTDIAHAIYSHEDAVLLNKDTPFDITHLLFFEPYMFCNSQCLEDAHSKQLICKPPFNDCITSRVDDFCKVLNVPLYQVAVDCSSSSCDHLKVVRMFQEWQSQSEGTYQCLRQHMDQYSVFSGRNILRLANVSQVVAKSTPSPQLSVTVPEQQKLDSKPTLQELQSRDLLHSRQYSSVMEGIAVKWMRVAIALNISGTRIDILDTNSRKVEDACLNMLQWWLQNAEQPTWWALIKALRDIDDLQVLAHDIEKALK